MNLSMFLGADGKVSAMRVCTIFITFSVIGIFIAQNIVSMINGLGFVNLSWEMISLVTAILGVKAYQQKYENSGPADVPDDIKKE